MKLAICRRSYWCKIRAIGTKVEPKNDTLKFPIYFSSKFFQDILSLKLEDHENSEVLHIACRWNLMFARNWNLRDLFTSFFLIFCNNPAGNYIFKSNNRNIRTRCEICSKLAIKTPERFEHISHLVLVLLLLT